MTCKQGPECGPGVTDSSQPGQSLSLLGASPAWIRQPHLQPQHQSKINNQDRDNYVPLQTPTTLPAAIDWKAWRGNSATLEEKSGLRRTSHTPWRIPFTLYPPSQLHSSQRFAPRVSSRSYNFSDSQLSNQSPTHVFATECNWTSRYVYEERGSGSPSVCSHTPQRDPSVVAEVKARLAGWTSQVLLVTHQCTRRLDPLPASPTCRIWK